MKKNNKGYVLLELVISMSIVFVIMLQFITLTMDMYKKNIEMSKQNNLENNIFNLYKEIGYDFINYNISSIEEESNIYTITYYRNDKDVTNIKTLNFSNNRIVYSETSWGDEDKNIYTYQLDSDKDITIDSSNSKIEYNNEILKLTLNINDKNYEFICANKIEGVSI